MTITIKDLTGGDVQGNGAFDELMRVTNAHLLQEFTKSRITGASYSEAYTASMAVNLQAATQFALSVPRANEEVKLLVEQRLKTIQETLLVQEQIRSIAASTALTEQQELLAAQNTLEATERVTIARQEIVKMAKDIEIADASLAQAAEQLIKTIAETDLVQQQVANALTNNTNLIRQQDKIAADTSFITQKAKTELAQILDQVDGAPVAGVIGDQRLLYQAQKDGFFRDAEQKILKQFIDTWVVRQTTDGAQAGPAGIDDASINEVVAKAKAGILIT